MLERDKTILIVGLGLLGGKYAQVLSGKGYTVWGIDSDAASDLFAILANREHRLPTMIASQTGPAHWLGELPDRVAADSIVNRLANHARTINLGQIDMRRLRHDHARADKNYWE